MSFTDAQKTCLRKYFAFSGRASRSEYWWFVLFLLLASAISTMIDRAVYGDELIERYVIDELTYAVIETTGPFESIFWMLTILPFLAAGWRRMHDTGRSGFFLFSPFIVILGLFIFVAFSALTSDTAVWNSHVGIVALIVITSLFALLITAIQLLWWLTRPSKPGTNEYGPNPHEVTP